MPIRFKSIKNSFKSTWRFDLEDIFAYCFDMRFWILALFQKMTFPHQQNLVIFAKKWCFYLVAMATSNHSNHGNKVMSQRLCLYTTYRYYQIWLSSYNPLQNYRLLNINLIVENVIFPPWHTLYCCMSLCLSFNLPIIMDTIAFQCARMFKYDIQVHPISEVTAQIFLFCTALWTQ